MLTGSVTTYLVSRAGKGFGDGGELVCNLIRLLESFLPALHLLGVRLGKILQGTLDSNIFDLIDHLYNNYCQP